MGRVKLLDCTLRDGAYLIDKKFGEGQIIGITEGLQKANMDYIEIGFFQDEGFGKGKTVYRNSEDAKRFIPKEKSGCKFTVLADYSRYSFSHLDQYAADGVDAVRACFFKKERFEVLNVCRRIKDLGYELFVQPVDILGYSDKEIIEFIEKLNEIEPDCVSIVDTFGAMYQEDLHRLFELIHHNLIPACKIGFHSHNNMQLSNALSQEFVRMTEGKREAVIDGTLSGMGRGAGNTPTELIAQYLVARQGASYDMDVILDIIDSYMDNIRARCSWGYSTEYFIAGAYGAHVNNVTYLLKKNSIKSKDIRYILNQIGREARKRYNYELLEQSYIGMLESKIDDGSAKSLLKQKIGEKPVLILVPGKSILTRSEHIKIFIKRNKPFVISVNFIHDEIGADFLYMSNKKRYQVWKNTSAFHCINKIMTSNFKKSEYDEKTLVVSFTDLVKCGWDTMDNSTIMLLRLLNSISVKCVFIAGFDGYSPKGSTANYMSNDLETESAVKNAVNLNREISEMLRDFCRSGKDPNMKIEFITPSRFEPCVKTGGLPE